MSIRGELEMKTVLKIWISFCLVSSSLSVFAADDKVANAKEESLESETELS